MSKENLFLSPIEKELRFKDWCEQEGIKLWALDLDDTVCLTRKIFKRMMSLTYDYLNSAVPTIPVSEWETAIDIIDNRLFEQYGVNPVRWDHTIGELAQKYDLSQEIGERAKQILASIYTTPSEWVPGAEAGLQFLQKAGCKMGIVTHAGHDWTWRKYHWLGLDRFLDWDDVHCINENGHKTTESWREAFRFFKVKPEEAAVVGDSPRSDINPAMESGVKHCFLVDSDLWSVHNQPVDASVIRIKQLTDIPDRVI